MVSGHYANIEQGTPLRSLLPADQFRTVSQETRDTVCLLYTSDAADEL